MHLEYNNFNLRILYSYNQRDEVLLHSFYEREGKLHTSYDLHAPIAIDRMKGIYLVKHVMVRIYFSL